MPPNGTAQIGPLLARIASDMTLLALVRDGFAGLATDYEHVETRIAEADAKLRVWHRGNEVSQRLAQVPGIGPVIASMLVMKTPDPRAFRSGRDFAAWPCRLRRHHSVGLLRDGLTPRDHSTAGKTRLGRITRAGDETLRSLLVVRASAVIRHTQCGKGRPMPWLLKLLARKPPKLVAVALANKMARIAWIGWRS